MECIQSHLIVMPDKNDTLPLLTRDLSDPVAIPEEGIDRAVDIMRSGRLHRYGEFAGGESEVAQLERDFASYMGCKYAVAMNSCGSSIFIALKCAGVRPDDQILVNAFTLAPVPGAIEHAGARPLFIECDDGCRMNLDDLRSKANIGAKFLLMSHMRGHIADMDAIAEICEQNGILLIEDCAHTLGAKWNDELSGSFGDVACFSLQSFKHLNAGEGGVLTTNDEDIAAMAILYSGSYMLYEQHGARPSSNVFERYRDNIPNLSMRMHELTAAIARPQLAMLEQRAKKWKKRYELLATRLGAIRNVRIPERPDQEDFVPSSIQFFLIDIDISLIPAVLEACAARGVDFKWFGSPSPQGFTSTWENWCYVRDQQALPHTRAMLDRLCDMRIPLSLTSDDCALIAEILQDAIQKFGIP